MHYKVKTFLVATIIAVTSFALVNCGPLPSHKQGIDLNYIKENMSLSITQQKVAALFGQDYELDEMDGVLIWRYPVSNKGRVIDPKDHETTNEVVDKMLIFEWTNKGQFKEASVFYTGTDDRLHYYKYLENGQTIEGTP